MAIKSCNEIKKTSDQIMHAVKRKWCVQNQVKIGVGKPYSMNRVPPCLGTLGVGVYMLATSSESGTSRDSSYGWFWWVLVWKLMMG